MKLDLTPRHLPLRLVAGAFILNSGLGKRGANEEVARQLHGLASGPYPSFKNVDAPKFVSFLSAGEIALGSALLFPAVPPALAGAALTAFSGGLLGLYFRTPGTRKPGSVFPTDEGLTLSKDSWLFAMGLSLFFSGLARRGRKKK